jgi:hypothetical protein
MTIIKEVNKTLKVCTHGNLEDSWHEDAPELSVLGRVETNLASLDLERRLLDGVAVLVLDESVHATVRLGQELDQGLLKKKIKTRCKSFCACSSTHQSVLFPEFGQLLSRRVLAARHLNRHFHATVPDVVEVLHSTCVSKPISLSSIFFCNSSSNTNSYFFSRFNFFNLIIHGNNS